MFSTPANSIQSNTDDCFQFSSTQFNCFHICSQNNQSRSVGRGTIVVTIPMSISKFQSKKKTKQQQQQQLQTQENINFHIVLKTTNPGQLGGGTSRLLFQPYMWCILHR